jgi:uncharacterized repeat protein (TIGR03803 family)
MKKSLFLLVVALMAFIQTHAQGTFWGMTPYGGPDNLGIIFKTSADGTGQTVQHNFTTPYPGALPRNGELVEATNGKFYGMTSEGGAFGIGVLFEYDPASSTYTKKLHFNGIANGSSPYGRLALGSNGKFYGMTSSGGTSEVGVLFEYDPVTNTITKKLDFNGTVNGRNPDGSLSLGSNGKFYGMTSQGGASNFGVLFEYDPATNTYTKKLDFNGTANGSNPYGSLALASNGKFYGMTYGGGTSGYGVLFEYNPATSAYIKKLDFNGTDGGSSLGKLTLGSNGKFYGMTYQGGTSNAGVLFQYDPVTNTYTKKLDFIGTNGLYPQGSLTLASNAKLYGMTYGGGTLDFGVLFEYDPTTNTFTKKMDFNGTVNGSFPLGSLSLGSNGKFLGTTYRGGTSNSGVLFEYDPTTNTYTKKLDFNGTANGSNPYVSLSLGTNEKLYGMAYEGGALGSGVLFEYDMAANTYTKKLEFNGAANGSHPLGSLSLGVSGRFYGVTYFGGALSFGVLFEYDPATNTYTKKLDFNGTENGSHPSGSLSLGSNGKFYGMTSEGGTLGFGVLFEYDPASNTYTKKLDFNGMVNGRNPYGRLSLASNGKFYGMTYQGGTSDLGVLFEYDPATNTYNKKLDFAGMLNGSNPYGSLSLGGNGRFYGMTYQGGTTGDGVLFEYDPATNTYTKKLDFNGTVNGRYPQGSLSLGGNGKFYGMTLQGGASNVGVLFEYDPATNTYTKKSDFDGTNGGYPRADLLFVKANQIITFGPLANKSIGDAPFNLTATASSTLAVTYASSNTAVATVSGSTVTIVGAGTTTISASQWGNASYNPASDVSQTLTVNKANQTITFATLANKSFGDIPFNLTATASSTLVVTYASSNPAVATVSGSTVTIVGAGTTTITASQAGNASYNAAPDVSQTLIVNKIDQTITFAPLTNKNFGDATFNLTATASSNLAVTYASSNTAVATVSGSTVTIVAAGTTTITASQSGNVTFNAAPDVPQTLTVDKANQTITFANLADKTVGDAPFALTATSTSSLAVSFSSSNNKVTISGSQATIVSAGHVTITAAQAGNATFNAAPSVERSFCIKPAKPTVTLSNANTESPTLTSNATVGNQWFLNGTAITGATNATLSVTAAGIYKVQVKVDDCTSDFSNEQTIIVTGDIEYINSSIEIFPNPVSDWLTVQLGETPDRKSVAVYQLNGQQTDAQETSGTEAKFYVANYGTGVYLVKVQLQGVVKVMRFLKN